MLDICVFLLVCFPKKFSCTWLLHFSLAFFCKQRLVALGITRFPVQYLQWLRFPLAFFCNNKKCCAWQLRFFALFFREYSKSLQNVEKTISQLYRAYILDNMGESTFPAGKLPTWSGIVTRSESPPGPAFSTTANYTGASENPEILA